MQSTLKFTDFKLDQSFTSYLILLLSRQLNSAISIGSGDVSKP